MYSSDQTILHAIKKWLTKDNEILLVTVAQTWGSSPRPVGSILALRNNGEVVGSVSGGCIEEDLIRKYCSHELSTNKVSKISYGVGQLDAQKFGLPCGGTLELILERIDSYSEFQSISNAIDKNQCVCRSININTGVSMIVEVDWQSSTYFDELNLHRVFGPRWNMLLIGANDLAKNVAMLAQPLGYHVTVCDPRELTDTKWINDSYSFSKEMPDDVVATLTPVKQSVVLTLTHDPKMDDMALMQALQMDFFFVGAIGSLKTQTARRKRLRQLDLTENQIAKLHGPVGIPIGSKQPLEIAISILAQLTQLRYQQSTNLATGETLPKLA